MSGSNINKEFGDFGKRMKVIAILTLLSFILGIVGAFIPLIGYVAILFSLIIIIFFLLVLGNVKRAGRELNNKELLGFTPRFLFGTIMRFIGQVLMNIGLLFLENLLILVIIGVVLIIVGCILRYKAWGGIQVFFETNAQLFPQDISINGNKGSKLCKISTILDMTIILSFIGEILRIIGYFKLASTKDLIGAPAQTISQPIAPQPVSASAPSAPSANFCPNCGSSVSPGARFCPGCGSSIN
jgi:hypothetical protein